MKPWPAQSTRSKILQKKVSIQFQTLVLWSHNEEVIVHVCVIWEGRLRAKKIRAPVQT